jgi:protein TonB
MSALRMPLHQARGPSLSRALAIAGTTTVNLAILGALMIPLAIDHTLVGPSRPEPVLEVSEVAPEVVPPAPLPIPPVAPDPPAPTRFEPVNPVVAEITTTPVIDTPSTEVASLPTPVDAPPTTPASTVVTGGPVNTALAYIHAPAPPYPGIELRNGHSGVVLLLVHVGTDGLPLSVEVKRSSGRSALDRAARQKVLREWRFQPAIRDGVAVEAIGLVPIKFEPQRG